MNTKTVIGILIVLVVIGGGFFMASKPKEAADVVVKEDTSEVVPPAPSAVPSTSAPKTQTAPSTPEKKPTSFSVAQVAQHNTAASCWTIVNGAVYDVTSWINKHPGGAGAIKGMCGIDASDEFNEQHGGDGGPERILASYKIGTLL